MLLTLFLLHKFLIILVPDTILQGILTYGRKKNIKKVTIFFIMIVIFFILTLLLGIQRSSTTLYFPRYFNLINVNDFFTIFMYVILGVYFCYFYRFSKLKMFISIFLFNMYMDIIVNDILNKYLFFIFTGGDMYDYYKFPNLLILKVDITVYLVILIVYLFVYNIYKYLDKKFKFSEVTMRIYVYIFIIFVVNFLSISIIIIIKRIENVHFPGFESEVYLLRDSVLRSLIYANIISNIFILIDIVKRNKINTQNKSIETRLDAQLSHYAEVKETHLKVRKLYHDINNHICCLENLNTSNEETNTYINNLKSELADFKKIYDTGNILLDTIINEKGSVCEKKGIEFSCNIDFSKINFLEPIDISSIFANILDNAIEACEKIHRQEVKKYVKIRGTINRSFYIIKCENSKANEILLEKNRLLTSKANKFVHGLGILSIESSLNKYNGSLALKEFEGNFRAIVYIPLNEDEREVED